jgi:hypothetical protein
MVGQEYISGVSLLTSVTLLATQTGFLLLFAWKDWLFEGRKEHRQTEPDETQKFFSISPNINLSPTSGSSECSIAPIPKDAVA